MKFRILIPILLLAQAIIAIPMQAASLPLTIDGTGPGSLTSRWHFVNDTSSPGVPYFGVGGASPCKPAL